MTTGGLHPDDDPDEPVVDEVRPYALTAGRTRAVVELSLETRLLMESGARTRRRPTDHLLAHILDVCEATPSVAEVSAKVGAPLGVVRVLIGDLIESGFLRVQATLTDSSSVRERHDLIERTLRGLRAI